MTPYSDFAQYYDRLTENVGYRDRAGYFDRLIREHAQIEARLLLDLACGTGSLSVELADLGYEVIGADASADMLSVAMQKSGGRILFLNQSMEELDLYGTVDAAVCALDSLNHLPDAAALNRAVAKVSLFLNPGGLFLFDLNTAYKHRQILGDNVFVYDLEEVYCVWQNHCDADSAAVEITLDFFHKTGQDTYRRSSEGFCEQYFDHQAVCNALEQSGLTLLQCYGDDTMEPPKEDTQRIIYVAGKQPNPERK